MTRLAPAALVSILLLGSLVSAQSVNDLAQSARLLQQQVDRLQAIVNVQIGDPAIRTWLDRSKVYQGEYPEGPGTTAMISGWAFKCGATTETEPRALVLIDGLPFERTLVVRLERPDVLAAWGAFCSTQGGIEPTPGVVFLVDLRHYAAGEHTIQLRLMDTSGATVDSNAITVTVPPPAQ